MNLTINSSVDVSGAPEINLGGVAFKIPRLMFRQASVIEPLLNKINLLNIRRTKAFVNLAHDESGNVDIEKANESGFWDTITITQDEIDVMLRIVLVAINRAYPNVTMDDILDLPASSSDFLAAVNIITSQIGAERKESTSGEAKAASL